MEHKKKYRTLIVDDEKYARRDLRILLSAYPEIEIIGEAKNISSAVELINEQNPDLIFLDIQFPGETGFDLFEKVHVAARVIFVTAYDAFAIRAFEVNACDYLLKPVHPKRLDLTIQRLHDNKEPGKALNDAFKEDDSIYIQLNNKRYFIRIDSIVKITAADHFTEVVTSKGIRGLSNKPLYEWIKYLPGNLFVQVHRSTIINMGYVEKIERGSNYKQYIKLKGLDEPTPISRRYLKQIKQQFST